jgi:Zn-dependent protease
VGQLSEFIIVLPVLIVSMVAHEYAHGYAALRQGDGTAKAMGRLTFNPVKHIDLWMSVLLPAMLWFGSGGQFLFGGAKPVPVNPRNYRQYRRGDIIVSLAGVATNLGLVVAFALLAVGVGIAGTSLGPVGGRGVWAVLQGVMYWGIWFNLLLANFNLIPIPPLDGSHVLYHLLPPEIALKYRELSRYGILILLAMIFFFPRALYVLLLPAISIMQVMEAAIRPFALTSFGLF